MKGMQSGEFTFAQEGVSQVPMSTFNRAKHFDWEFWISWKKILFTENSLMLDETRPINVATSKKNPILNKSSSKNCQSGALIENGTVLVLITRAEIDSFWFIGTARYIA